MALDFSRSYISRLDSIDWEYVNRIYEEMEQEALSSLIKTGASRDEITFERSADMRYTGQFYEIPSPIPNGNLGPQSIPEITEAFYKAYEKAFSRYMTDTSIQALTWNLRAECPSPSLEG
jgi:N-methylhydantoinase A